MKKYRIKAVELANSTILYSYQKRELFFWRDIQIEPVKDLEKAKMHLESMKKRKVSYIY